MSSTPSIRISRDQFHGSESYPRYPPYSAASPMAIPRSERHVPPPLPPPSFIPELSAGQDPGWRWGNDPNGADFGRPSSVKPGSSLLGRSAGSAKQGKELDITAQYPFYEARRGSSLSTVTLEHDHEMHDEAPTQGMAGTNLSRPSSNG